MVNVPPLHEPHELQPVHCDELVAPAGPPVCLPVHCCFAPLIVPAYACALLNSVLVGLREHDCDKSVALTLVHAGQLLPLL